VGGAAAPFVAGAEGADQLADAAAELRRHIAATLARFMPASHRLSQCGFMTGRANSPAVAATAAAAVPALGMTGAAGRDASAVGIGAAQILSMRSWDPLEHGGDSHISKHAARHKRLQGAATRRSRRCALS